MNHFAVIASHNRHDLLRACVAAIGPQVDMVIVVDNASDPPVQCRDLVELDVDRHWAVTTIQVDEQPPNLARNWNVGLDAARALYEAADPQVRGRPYVAVLNDDAAPPAGWFATVTQAMQKTGAVVGCSNPWGTLHPPRVKTVPDRNLSERMPGWAWVLDLLSPVRPDESLRWWWNDTDVDWQGRLAGGMVMVGGYAVPNAHPNGWTIARPELAAQARQDGPTFAAKWSAYGGCPW